MPVVCTRASSAGLRSTRRTFRPPRLSRWAHSRPANPAPTTTTSRCSNPSLPGRATSGASDGVRSEADRVRVVVVSCPVLQVLRAGVAGLQLEGGVAHPEALAEAALQLAHQ